MATSSNLLRFSSNLQGLYPTVTWLPQWQLSNTEECEWIYYMNSQAMERKYNFDENFITRCTGSCYFDNRQCDQWWKIHQKYAYVKCHAYEQSKPLKWFARASLMSERWAFNLITTCAEGITIFLFWIICKILHSNPLYNVGYKQETFFSTVFGICINIKTELSLRSTRYILPATQTGICLPMQFGGGFSSKCLGNLLAIWTCDKERKIDTHLDFSVHPVCLFDVNTCLANIHFGPGILIIVANVVTVETLVKYSSA